jgi:hypothetical protein
MAKHETKAETYKLSKMKFVVKKEDGVLGRVDLTWCVAARQGSALTSS